MSSEIIVDERMEFRHVETQMISDDYLLSADGQLPVGGTLIELRSDKNLEQIVQGKQMAFLYYSLFNCEVADTSQDIWFHAAYVKKESGSPPNTYYALIPEDIEDRVRGYHKMMGKEPPSDLGNICIGLGAGNMAGQSVATNRVPLNLEN